MNPKERILPQTRPTEHDVQISAPPIFDLERLEELNARADDWLMKEGLDFFPAVDGFDTLGIALRLGLYNLSFVQPIDPDASQIFFKRFRSLAEREASFSDTNNPFPTIGVEVEGPRKIVKAKYFNTYAVFLIEWVCRGIR